jgi:hypothetical protein
MAQSSQRLAPGPHLLLGLWNGFDATAGHPDVFPGDPLFDLDPIFQSILDPAARQRLIARYDHDLTQPEYATGYRWDIVVCDARRTWTEDDG